jgi:predicted AAA+ superfamily ATPase
VNETPYIKRIVDQELADQMQSMGAVLIEGPKWCGKTRTSLEASRSAFFVSQTRELATDLPEVALSGETPRLIDEWQLVPKLWDHARALIDERAEPGQFIFTGSVVPEKEKPTHSGAGRFARVLMRSLSLYESGESSGQVSLKALFDGNAITVQETALPHIEDMVWALVRGGWPASLRLSRVAAARIPRNYLAAIEHADVEFVEDDSISWDQVKIRLLLQSLARVSAMSVNLTKTVEDVRARAGILTRKTAAYYVNALKRLFIIDDQPAWSGSLRSKVILRETPKRHFIDPSLSAAALNASPEKLMQDHETLGLLFESLCYRDLNVYAQPLDGVLYHFRDSSGYEIDDVIVLPDGRWAVIEVKLGEMFIEEAAAKLLAVTERINTRTIGAPSFSAILHAGRYAYQRKDGVFVIPLGCLGP